MAELLIDNGLEVSELDFEHAINPGNLKIIKKLISKGLKIPQWTLRDGLERAIYISDLKMAEYLMGFYSVSSFNVEDSLIYSSGDAFLFIRAIQQSNSDMVKLFLDKGVHVKSAHIEEARNRGDKSIIELLSTAINKETKLELEDKENASIDHLEGNLQNEKKIVPDSPQIQAKNIVLKHIESSSSDHEDSVTRQVSCFREPVDYFDKKNTTLQMIQQDCSAYAADNPIRKFKCEKLNVEDIPGANGNYRVEAFVDCTLTNKQGKIRLLKLKTTYQVEISPKGAKIVYIKSKKQAT